MLYTMIKVISANNRVMKTVFNIIFLLFIIINCLSAKSTNEVMKPGVWSFAVHIFFAIISTEVRQTTEPGEVSGGAV